jgi:hypothetical protein
MNINRSVILWTGAFVAALAFAVSAQDTTRMGRGKHNMYNPATVETVKGTVVTVVTSDREFRRMMVKGLHVDLKTEKERLIVFLGPEEYVGGKITLKAGDQIEVTGSRMNAEGKPGIIAREVKKGELTVQLRKEDGTPLWPMGSGSRRKGR